MTKGVPPQAGSGHSPKGGAASSTASPAQPSVPNAVTISGELYAFLMGEGQLEGVWFGEMNRGFRGAFWWRALLRCAAGWPDASAAISVASSLSGIPNASFTPGPWDVTGCTFPDDDFGGVYYRVVAEGMVASGANARLVSAAPDLVNAACGALEHMEWSTPQGREAYDALRAALLKAVVA
jgi:hypothetical protein